MTIFAVKFNTDKQLMNHPIENCIGNTPLIKLKNIDQGKSTLYAKLELMNPSGSMKDRVALNILKNGLKSGKIKVGDTIIESSSGNMGIALSHLCAHYGLNSVIVTDPNSNPLNRAIMQNYGAKVVEVKEKCAQHGWHGARIDKVKSLMSDNPNMYWTNQYENPLNPNAHISTMNEILEGIEGELDYMFVSASSCGTLMGCLKAIKSSGSKTQLVVIDAEGSILFSDQPGNKVIPGHGSSNRSKLLGISTPDVKLLAKDEDCIDGCYRLLKEQGIMAGGSSGGSYYAATKFIAEQNHPVTCAMIICDRGERYLDTIYNSDWVKDKT